MNRVLITIMALGLLVAACSSADNDGVASLSGTDTTIVDDADIDTSADDEEILLEFAACMRENGVEGFEDPTLDADGVPQFNLRGGEDDRETTRAAFEACQDHLEGLAFGPGSIDLTEVEDTLVEFAACMRDNGYDMPDPDLASFANRGEGGPGGGPFGGELDPDDPDFIAALAECEHIFENLPFVGGGGRGGGPGGGGNG